MSDSLENFKLFSVDGTPNPGYYSSSSDSERPISEDRSGETDSIPGCSTDYFSNDRLPGVSSMQKVAESSAESTNNRVPHSHRGNEALPSGDGNDVDFCSPGGFMVTEKSDSNQQISDVIDDSCCESNSLAPHQQTSEPIGARLVVSSPALNQQSSVRVPAAMPHTCSSLVSNNAASYYSDSELIPQKNNVSHSVAKMVATEYLVLKQQPKVPQVYVLSSDDKSRERVPSSSRWKSLTIEQRRQNRAEIQKTLHNWQRSLSAGNTPASRHPLPNNGIASSSKPRAGLRSHLLKHTVSSPGHGPVHGSADVAGMTPDSFLHSSGVSAITPDSAANHSSFISNSDDAIIRENSITETTNSPISAKEDSRLENVQSDDGVFEDQVSANIEKYSSVEVIDTSQTDGLDQSASTSDNSSGQRDGVPNRAILRRGSGK